MLNVLSCYVCLEAVALYRNDKYKIFLQYSKRANRLKMNTLYDNEISQTPFNKTELRSKNIFHKYNNFVISLR